MIRRPALSPLGSGDRAVHAVPGSRRSLAMEQGKLPV